MASTSGWFIYDIFELITPYMTGKGFVGNTAMVKPSPPGEPDLSLSAATMHDLLRGKLFSQISAGFSYRLDNPVIKDALAAFSLDTLRNVVRARLYQTDRDIEEDFPRDKPEFDWSNASPSEIVERKAAAQQDFQAYMNDRNSLTRGVIAVIGTEAGTGKNHPRDYPVINLLSGLFYDGNWRWLSDADFWIIAQCYGAKPGANTKDQALQLIINSQNFMVTELIVQGYIKSFTVGGVDTLTPLIQNVLEIGSEAKQQTASSVAVSAPVAVAAPVVTGAADAVAAFRHLQAAGVAPGSHLPPEILRWY